MGLIGKTRLAILKKSLLLEEKKQKEREKAKATQIKKANAVMKKEKEIKDLEIELKKRIAKSKKEGLTPSELKLLKARKEHIEKQKRNLKESAKKVFSNTGKFLVTIGRGIDRSLNESEKQLKKKAKKKPKKKKKK